MKKIFLAFCAIFLFSWPALANYDVTAPHVIINQILGGKDEALISHSFIELYNPTEATVDLSSYAIHYRSSTEDKNYGDKWYKLNLTGTIPSKHSYLIRCQEHTDSADAIYKVENFDIEFLDPKSGGG
ncbi:MAG: lamin tail domain-containing protein [Synergistaceae bacterium]|nr:lamin tail domain-containing protein [Synergistaceae bacterium]